MKERRKDRSNNREVGHLRIHEPLKGTLLLRGLFLCSLLMTTLWSCNISIQKLPSTSYAKMSEEEREQLHYSSDSSVTFTERDYRSAEEVELYEIDEERLFTLMDSSLNTWVYLWATDCPYYLMNLKKQKLHEKDSARTNMQLIFIAANYDPPIIKKYVYRTGYRKPVFVIDAERYGKDLTRRIHAFAEAIVPEPLDSMEAMPQHFLFKGKKWTAQLNGTMSSPEALSDTLDHYFD